MHEIESKMKADRKEPEVKFAKRLFIHAARHLGKPIVERSEYGKQDAAYDDVVKMRYDEIGVRQLPVKRSRAQHDTGQPGD